MYALKYPSTSWGYQSQLLEVRPQCFRFFSHYEICCICRKTVNIRIALVAGQHGTLFVSVSNLKN